eukprot:scaffold59658_cov26-Attheya_sp.AAC.1
MSKCVWKILISCVKIVSKGHGTTGKVCHNHIFIQEDNFLGICRRLVEKLHCVKLVVVVPTYHSTWSTFVKVPLLIKFPYDGCVGLLGKTDPLITIPVLAR